MAVAVADAARMCELTKSRVNFGFGAMYDAGAKSGVSASKASILEVKAGARGLRTLVGVLDARGLDVTMAGREKRLNGVDGPAVLGGEGEYVAEENLL